MVKKEEPSGVFLERSKLQKQEEKILTLKHKFKMEELEFIRRTEKIIAEEKVSYYRLKRADEYRKLGLRPS